MKNLEEAVTILRQVWPVLGPYRERVVVVGGIAAHLYQLVPGFRAPDLLRVLHTVDLDLGLPRPLAVGADGMLLDRFRAAGMEPYETRQAVCSATRIDLPVLPGESSTPYVEFLAAAEGEVALDDLVQGGLRAHLSAYAWMLFARTWTVDLPAGIGQVRLPHPLGYAAQKVIIATTTRPYEKRAKDLADALFVLGGLAGQWPRIFGEADELASCHPEGRGHLDQARGIWRDQFAGRATSPAAALIAQRMCEGRPDLVPAVRAVAALVGRDAASAWDVAKLAPADER